MRTLNELVRPVKCLGICAGIVTLSISTAQAQDAETEEVVVTATRMETPISKVGSSTTVITAEEIERDQAREVIDVLRKVPGLSITQTGSFGASTSIFMRGMSAYHTQLLIDGVEMADPSAAQPSYDFGHLMVTDIERIEIVRGPQSTLYGGDAMGGVINIITKKGKGAPRSSVSAEYGSYNTKNLKASLSGAHQKLSYAVSASYLDTQGFSSADERNGNDEDDGAENLTINANFGVQFTDNFSVETKLRHMRSEIEYDNWAGGRAVDRNDNMRKRESSAYLGANLALFDNRLTNKFGVSYISSERDTYLGDARNSYFDGDKNKFEYQGNFKITDAQNIVFGAETEQEHTEQAGIDQKVRNNGYFATYQIEAVENLVLSAGARLDDHEKYGNHDTYRLTGSYTLDSTQTRFHSSLGTGFRAPSLYELYESVWGGGNPNLKPEESRGWDFGVEQPLWEDRIVLDVTYFENTTKNLINWVGSGYVNINEAEARGVETGLSVDLLDNLSLAGTYTYTLAENKSTGGTLARRPKHEGTLSLAYEPMDDLTTDLSVRAKGRTFDSATSSYMGGFAVYDFKTSYKINDVATVFGRVENIFDKDYHEASSYGTGGRAAYVGVRASF
ncbi:TonB-dependent receptor plug domain-containing protein [Terasakiella pusilla]|uniref:TonB-dependent receptor plug domain-containing protein n=1 Tax=Terasakiella pusilla TaxID=64973 RepID=UPI003AA88A0D